MGTLGIVAVECNYQIVDRQLKEQIIKELTTAKNNDCITSGGVLAWAKRVEVKRAQVAVLRTITKSRQFDKIKSFLKSEGKQHKNTGTLEHHIMPAMQILWQDTSAKTMPSVW